MTFAATLLLTADKVIGRCSAAMPVPKVRKNLWHRLSLSCSAILLLCLAPSAAMFGQNSAATLPNIRISSGGQVTAMVPQEDGKLIIAGSFTSVNEVARTNLARINP